MRIRDQLTSLETEIEVFARLMIQRCRLYKAAKKLDGIGPNLQEDSTVWIRGPRCIGHTTALVALSTVQSLTLGRRLEYFDTTKLAGVRGKRAGWVTSEWTEDHVPDLVLVDAASCLRPEEIKGIYSFCDSWASDDHFVLVMLG